MPELECQDSDEDHCHGLQTISSNSLDCACGAKGAGIGNAHNGNQDDSVENGRQILDAGKLDRNDKRRMAGLGTRAAVQRTVCRDDQTNEEEVHDVEDADAPYDLF